MLVYPENPVYDFFYDFVSSDSPAKQALESIIEANLHLENK